MKSTLKCTMLIFILAVFASAQQADQSTTTEASLKLRGKEITIKYAAPSMEGRKIFGDLVPFNEVWPAEGALATMHTDSALDIQGLSVPKGDYSLSLLPEEKAWYLIFNRRRKPSDPWQELGRVRMRVTAADEPIETWKIALSGRGLAGKLELGWENSTTSARFYLDLTKKNSEW